MPYIIGSQHPIIHLTHLSVGLYVLFHYGHEYNPDKPDAKNPLGLYKALVICIICNFLCILLGYLIQYLDYKLMKSQSAKTESMGFAYCN